MKVIATDKFKKENLRPTELDKVPAMGDVFEVTEDRFEFLSKKGFVLKKSDDKKQETPIENEENSELLESLGITEPKTEYKSKKNKEN